MEIGSANFVADIKHFKVEIRRFASIGCLRLSFATQISCAAINEHRALEISSVLAYAMDQIKQHPQEMLFLCACDSDSVSVCVLSKPDVGKILQNFSKYFRIFNQSWHSKLSIVLSHEPSALHYCFLVFAYSQRPTRAEKRLSHILLQIPLFFTYSQRPTRTAETRMIYCEFSHIITKLCDKHCISLLYSLLNATLFTKLNEKHRISTSLVCTRECFFA